MTKELLKTVRIELLKRGMTLTGLARELNLNYNYMYQCLNGQRNSSGIEKQVKEYLGIKDK